MKHLQSIFVIALSFMLLLSSCSDSTNTEENITNSMSAIINSDEVVNFSSSDKFVTINEENAGNFYQTLISGVKVINDKTYTITMKFKNFSRNIGEQAPRESMLKIESKGVTINQILDLEAKFNITNIKGDLIQGNFSFKGSDISKSFTISNGQFNLKYILKL